LHGLVGGLILPAAPLVNQKANKTDASIIYDELPSWLTWLIGLRGTHADDYLEPLPFGGPVYAFGGDDVIEVSRASFVSAGAGADTVVLDEHADAVFGGHGNDTLVISDPFDRFDIGRGAGALIEVVNRFSGETTKVRGIETFDFADEQFAETELRNIADGDAGPAILVGDGTQALRVNNPDPTLSVVWDRAVQQAVIEETGNNGPTIASRAYAMVHTAIFDAFATYDPTAVRVSLDAGGDNDVLEALAAAGSHADMTKAMNVAAHSVLSVLYPDQAPLFDTILSERYGIPVVNDGTVAYAIGLDAAADLVALRADDGANRANDYADTTGYAPTNVSAGAIVDIARWTPENVPIDPEGGPPDQVFLTPHWGGVTAFTDEEFSVPAPEPFFLPAYADAVLDIDARTITLPDDSVMPVDRDLVGTVINPAFIEQADAIVAASAALGDKEKLIAEFWEDAGGTPFPPGTWMAFAQYVSARDDHDVVDDAKMFFAAANAVFEAGVHIWDFKVDTDYARPVRAIRELGELELLKGNPGVDEVTGEKGYVIKAFGGFDENGIGRGSRTILAENFVTYQRPEADASPPFAEYTSGHSGFSAAGAAVLRAFTGSHDFGGMVAFSPGSAQFDPTTPAEELVLAWDTFSAAADEAAISRIYGGIHFDDGDLNGRAVGSEIGDAVYALAERFWEGTATDADRPFYGDELMIG